jgi:hypothetical protein
MTLYLETSPNAALWPAPIEQVYQLLGGGDASMIAPKLPHLGLADVLFISSIMSLPKDRRPWGIVSWMADVFLTSRPTLYSLAHRVIDRLTEKPALQLTGKEATQAERIEVTETRVVRTVLTGAFPGKMALRPMQQVLSEAFDSSRSVGWLSELLTSAGQTAGKILAQTDLSGLGPVRVIRDETFFQDQPLLLMVEPVTSTLLMAMVAPDRQADTWGTLLLLAQDCGVQIAGLVEDMARMYPKSQKEAELDVAVQKDTWHLERDGGQVRRDLERMALRATQRVMELETQLRKRWDDTLFMQKYIPAVHAEEKLYDQHAHFSLWFDHLCDALEVVDWRSGEIRDKATNQWLLTESLAALAQLDHASVQSWVKTLRRHQSSLLTWMDWLAPALAEFRARLAQVIDSPTAHTQFMQLVAQTWRLRQALVNGYRHLRNLADQTTSMLASVIAGSEPLALLAQQLNDLLDTACRSSSLVESINGLLKQFLHNRRAFASAETLQNYLNLFTLWHNMRPYVRGKREGKSPFQWAGIELASNDWLDLLGYPIA